MRNLLLDRYGASPSYVASHLLGAVDVFLLVQTEVGLRSSLLGLVNCRLLVSHWERDLSPSFVSYLAYEICRVCSFGNICKDLTSFSA